MDRPLRLITASPVDRLARTIEALLVVASQPLSVDDLAEAANDDAERVETERVQDAATHGDSEVDAVGSLEELGEDPVRRGRVVLEPRARFPVEPP